MAQIGGPDDEEKQFASLLPGQSIETLTLEEALDLFKLPRVLGEHEGKKVTAAIGRFGPYVRYDGKFVSLKAADGDDPYTVTLERAMELVSASWRQMPKRSSKCLRKMNPFASLMVDTDLTSRQVG